MRVLKLSIIHDDSVLTTVAAPVHEMNQTLRSGGFLHGRVNFFERRKIMGNDGL